MVGVACPDCGHFVAGDLVLRGSVGTLEFSLGSEVGRLLLPRAVGDDAQFAETAQFILRRDDSLGWMIEACAAKNPTRRNDAELAVGIAERIEAGDVITVGSRRARLAVELKR